LPVCLGKNAVHRYGNTQGKKAAGRTRGEKALIYTAPFYYYTPLG